MSDSVTLEGICIAVLVVASVVVIHALLDVLDRWARSHRHVQGLLARAYRELFVFGLLSFVLFVIERALSGSTAIETTQRVHVTLWVAAVVYGCFVTALVVLSRRSSHEWHALEASCRDFARYKAVRVALAAAAGQLVAAESHACSPPAWLSHPRLALEYAHRLHEARFAELRQQFIVRQGLPHSFSFALYLTQ